MIIDGSFGEGGGQILRTAVALSCITGKEVEIRNIRANRPKPGLAAQHLAGLQAAVRLTDAETEGLHVGSTSVKFYPRKIKGGFHRVDIGTAGSVTLVLQTLLMPAIRANEEVILEITGGTDVSWSPTMTYFHRVFCDFMKKMNIDVYVETEKYGFYPKGGGKVKVRVTPAKNLNPLILTERGELKGIDIWSIASDQLKSARVSERQIDGAKEFLKMNFEKANVVYAPTLSPGSSVHINAHYENCKLGASSLGEKGKPAEMVGREAALLLKKQMDSGACLDEWSADQIIPYLAVFGSKVSVAEITQHAKTNMWVCEQFGARLGIEGNVISSLTTL